MRNLPRPTVLDLYVLAYVTVLAPTRGDLLVPLPSLDAQGLLPTTPTPRHDGTEAEVEALFVDTAPSHKSLRRDIWDSYTLWARRASVHFGHGRAWLAGTFVTHMTREPHLRVAFFPSTPSMVGNAVRRGDVGLGLVTLGDVFYMTPSPGGSVEALRPVGGTMDSQVGSMVHSDGWDAMWSLVGDPRSHVQLAAGYVSMAV